MTTESLALATRVQAALRAPGGHLRNHRSPHGGENVYCVEVEGVLTDHPAVADAAVLGVPHPTLGEEVAAVLVLHPGAVLDAEAVREHVAERLAAFKVPARVVFRADPLPRNPIGKILKRELRADIGRLH